MENVKEDTSGGLKNRCFMINLLLTIFSFGYCHCVSLVISLITKVSQNPV